MNAALIYFAVVFGPIMLLDAWIAVTMNLPTREGAE